MKNLTLLAMCSILIVGSAGLHAQNNQAGCTIEREQATCNWTAFRKALDAAHTAKPEYRDRDKSTGMQLKDLVTKLGKNVPQDGGAADLTLTVIPANATGIDMSSADKEILELHIYAGTSDPQNLIWVETYIGQRDRPWPANVQSTIAQFLKRLSKDK
jgi:hypothetical protein